MRGSVSDVPSPVTPQAVARFARRVAPWAVAAAAMAAVWTLRTAEAMPRWYEATVVVVPSAPQRLPPDLPWAVPSPLGMGRYAVAVRSDTVAGAVYGSESWSRAISLSVQESAGDERLTVRVRAETRSGALERADRLVARLLAWDRARARDAVATVVNDARKALLDVDVALATQPDGTSTRSTLEAWRVALQTAVDAAEGAYLSLVPVANDAFERMVSLPLHPGLSDEDVQDVIDAVSFEADATWERTERVDRGTR